MIDSQEIEPGVSTLSSSDTFPAGESPSKSGEWVLPMLIKVNAIEALPLDK